MRNSILIPILFFSIISDVNAQKTRFGILAGPAITSSAPQRISIAGDNSYTSSSHNVTSYFVGVVASVPVSKNIIFRPQLGYIQKGWKTHVDFVAESSTDLDRRIKANCIDVPLNFVYDAPTKSGRFFIGTGPYLSYCFSFSDMLTPANRTDVGINVLAGYEFRGGFFLSLNYSHGFVDFIQPYTIIYENGSRTSGGYKHTVLGLSLGFMFK